MEATVGPPLCWEAMEHVWGRCGPNIDFSRIKLINECVYAQLAGNADFAVEIASRYLCSLHEVSPEQIQADLQCIDGICQDTYNAPRLETGNGAFVSLQDKIIGYCLALRRVVALSGSRQEDRNECALALLSRAKRKLVHVWRQVVAFFNDIVPDIHRSVLDLGHAPIKDAPGPYRWMLNVNLRACCGKSQQWAVDAFGKLLRRYRSELLELRDRVVCHPAGREFREHAPQSISTLYQMKMSLEDIEQIVPMPVYVCLDDQVQRRLRETTGILREVKMGHQLGVAADALCAFRRARDNGPERRRWAREVITLDLLIPNQTTFYRGARDELCFVAGELSRHVCIC